MRRSSRNLARASRNLVAVVGVVSGLLAPTSAQVVPLCVTEDDPGPCLWLATEQGNGQGRSFFVVEDRVFYLPLPSRNLPHQGR